ncbi:MAG TPA: hypothetical protein DDX39_04650 [Bacteroidales bacterium]|nr:MAG: hypothetical protein A2W98_01830 [Bacteroidetes bacterium GWF2_33_38]OFY73758.1 MAG: hypothetical protein A2265_10360 [Bacteroidetes bacterium RIFOXYA12_FULL_33_9]OFY89882.1 MAG: hypothetical protein A2236_07230 [Bacteroidetes bacterium RIFOXYA2_FULL_33_7]HBF87914.1 hypothetical protein [Bacteroidales bacterium]
MRLVKYWKSILWTVIVFVLSSVSGNDLNKIPTFDIPHLDKIVHFVMYFVLSFFLFIDFTKRDNIKTTIVFYILLFSFLYGVSMEFMQEYVFEKRSASIFDTLANLSGSIVSILLLTIFYKMDIRFNLWKK